MRNTLPESGKWAIFRIAYLSDLARADIAPVPLSKAIRKTAALYYPRDTFDISTNLTDIPEYTVSEASSEGRRFALHIFST